MQFYCNFKRFSVYSWFQAMRKYLIHCWFTDKSTNHGWLQNSQFLRYVNHHPKSNTGIQNQFTVSNHPKHKLYFFKTSDVQNSSISTIVDQHKQNMDQTIAFAVVAKEHSPKTTMSKTQEDLRTGRPGRISSVTPGDFMRLLFVKSRHLDLLLMRHPG